MKAKKKVAVLSLWRDSESYIERSLSQFNKAESELSDLQFIYGFLENDSKDDTAAILNSWIKTKIGFVISERIQAPKWGSVQSTERTKWMARYRNVCLSLLDFWAFDYLLVADSDVHYHPNLIETMVMEMENDPTLGMITPNTVQDVTDAIGDTGLPSYYDSWALVDKNGKQAMTFAANPFLDKRDRDLWDEGFLVDVSSAFGSIALIRGSILEEYDIAWDGENGCEHWGLCKGIRDAGYTIMVDPELHAKIKHKEPVVPNPDVVEFHKKRLKEFGRQFNNKGDEEYTMTFGICTGYENAEHLINCVDSIRNQQLDDYQIILVGPEVPDLIYDEIAGDDVEFIEFDESVRSLWITKKKNLIARKAGFDRLCLLHDYLWLTPKWAKELREFEKRHPWSVLAFPQQRSDGGRFWYDWSGFRGARHLDDRQFYKYTDWTHNDEVYISGNIFCVNRHLLLDHPFDESLGHMQEEDLEWSRRIAPYVQFKCAFNSMVCHQKEHRDLEYFEKVDRKYGQ